MTDVALNVHESAPFIITQSDEALGWGSVSHPYIARVTTNRIMLTYFYNGDPAIGDRAGSDWPAYSDDRGITWQFGSPYTWSVEADTNTLGPLSYEMGDIVGKAGFSYGYCFGMVQHTGGCWTAHARRANPKAKAPGVYSVQGIYSTNYGKTYNTREILYLIPTNWGSEWILISPLGSVLSNKSSLTVGYIRDPDYEKKFSSEIFRSDDYGATYRHISTIADYENAPWGNHGPAEPGMLKLDNGDIICLIRTGSDGFSKSRSTAMLMATSEDNGHGWRYKRMSLPGVMPTVVQLENEVLAATFGRPGNNLIFSLDGGRSWGHELTITPPDIKSSGYLDVMEVSPNRLLVVYDAYDTTTEKVWLWEPPEPVNALWGMFIEVRRR